MKYEQGATMVEYVLMVALVAIALVVGVVLFQGGITNSVEEATDCMESIQGGGAADCPGVSQN